MLLIVTVILEVVVVRKLNQTDRVCTIKCQPREGARHPMVTRSRSNSQRGSHSVKADIKQLSNSSTKGPSTSLVELL